MIVIYLFVFLISLILAVMSRIHFSKYKDRGVMKAIPFSIGATLYSLLFKYLPVNRVKEKIRNVNMLTERGLNKATEEYFVRIFALGYGALLIFTLLSAFAFGLSLAGDGAPDNIVTRPDYGGDEAAVDMMLSSDGSEQTYQLVISPQIYTREQFEEKAEETFRWLEQEITGDNEDLKHVSSDLNLVTQTEDGVFDIVWQSANPAVLSSTGTIKDATENEEVSLEARIEYYEYLAVHEYKVELVSSVSEEALIFDDAIDALVSMEADNREEKELLIPDAVGSVSVRIEEEKSNPAFGIFVLGIIIAACLMIKQSGDLKHTKTVRENMLIYKYTELVNHLWLFLGTGMTMKNALYLYAENGTENSVLKKEIMYTLNKIRAGMDEIIAYEELGDRLDIPEYSRLFGHICQNMRMGTKNIRNIMEEELGEAVSIRSEGIKKKGEEASTKLILPMVIMLAVVMIIVMIPALTGFGL